MELKVGEQLYTGIFMAQLHYSVNACSRSSRKRGRINITVINAKFYLVWAWPDHCEGRWSGNIGIPNLFYRSYSSGNYEYSIQPSAIIEGRGVIFCDVT